MDKQIQMCTVVDKKLLTYKWEADYDLGVRSAFALHDYIRRTHKYLC